MKEFLFFATAALAGIALGLGWGYVIVNYGATP